MNLVWIDGRLVDKNDARVSVFDHGFLYGDGVWEGLRAYAGTPFRLREHVAQLFRSADAIDLRILLTADDLAVAVAQTLRANNRTDGYVRVIVTRGAGTLGLDPRKCEPTVVVIAEEIGLYPRELHDAGLDVVTLDLPRPFPRGTLLSRAGLVAAKAAALRAGCFEALRFDPSGRLLGATEAAAFVVAGGALRPDDDDHGGPDRVTREVVLQLAAAAGVALGGPATRADVSAADEVFLAGAAGGLIAVAKIDCRPVGAGSEGPVTRRLRDLYDAATRRTE